MWVISQLNQGDFLKQMWVMREEEVAFESSNLLLTVDEVELFSGRKNRFSKIIHCLLLLKVFTLWF